MPFQARGFEKCSRSFREVCKEYAVKKTRRCCEVDFKLHSHNEVLGSEYMKRGIRYTIGGLAIAAVLGLTYVLNFGLYPRYFDITWDEEVQLHDGRMIVVHVKRTFE